MIDTRVEEFLEKHNINYLFLILASLEAERLSSLSGFAKNNLKKKLTEESLLHVALNDVPDYIAEEIEMQMDSEEISNE